LQETLIMGKKHLWLTVVLLVLLSGCGFHLRGSVALAPSLSSLYLDGGDAELRQALTSILDFSGATLQTSATRATTTLKITKNNFVQRVRSVDNRGKATGYYLDYQATITLTSVADGKVILAPVRLLLTRDYDYNSDNVLQVENEVKFLKKSMHREMAIRIGHRLESVH